MNELYLGVAQEIITPEIGGELYGYRPKVYSKSKSDDLTATAFYFKQGDTEALMISLTLCLIHNDLSNKVLDLIEKEVGINRNACMISAIHTHSGPNTAGEVGWGEIDREYCDKIFFPAILKVATNAKSNPVPVKVGAAAGKSLVGVNRREIHKRWGKQVARLGQNPDAPVNTQMTVISFEDNDGKNIANIIHYGAHCTAAGENHEITRDWAGPMIDALEKEKGGITAFFNGPEGDVGPRLSNGKTTGNLKHVYKLGAIAANDAVKIGNKITEYHDIDLSVSCKELRLPLKKRISVEEANALYKKYKYFKTNLKGMIKMHALDVLESYKNDFSDEEYFSINQTAICLGDIVFVSFPFELFCEIGMEINKKFEDKQVLSLSCTNGSDGYFMAENSIKYGGYELGCFLYCRLQQFCDHADEKLIECTVEHLENLI